MLRACVDLVCFADVLGNAIMSKSSALFVATRLLSLFGGWEILWTCSENTHTY